MIDPTRISRAWIRRISLYLALTVATYGSFALQLIAARSA